MFVRNVLVACVLSLMATSAMADNQATRELFRFGLFNPPCVESDCEITPEGEVCVNVVTNTCTQVTLSYSPFVRREKNCENEPLDVSDVVLSGLSRVRFEEVPCKDDAIGAAFGVRPVAARPGLAVWKVESHKGGYRFYFNIRQAEAFECDDDAGWYQASANVIIRTCPIDDEAIPAVVCLTAEPDAAG